MGKERVAPAISICKLLYIKRINNKVLLHSMGNYIQYPVITIMEKNRKIMHIYTSVCIYVYMHIGITESLCHIEDINITL